MKLANHKFQITLAQWGLDYFYDFYPQGKSSIESRLNIPGKLGWFSMEVPSMIILLYTMYSLPRELGLPTLPGANWLLATLFVSGTCFLSVGHN